MRFTAAGVAGRLGLAVAAFAPVAGCSRDLPLGNGTKVDVVREVRPPDSQGTYILVYRSSRDCSAVAAELDEVWAVARPRADASGSRVAVIVAETRSHSSATANYLKTGAKAWRALERVNGCEPEP